MFNQVSSLLKAVLVLALLLIGLTEAKANDLLQDHINKYCKGAQCISAKQLLKIAEKVSVRDNIPVNAILAIVHTESKFNIRAKNGSSVGLTQVLLKYHRSKFKSKNYFDPEDNISVGSSYFKFCYTKHKGNLGASFSCYNGYGEGDPKYRKKTHRTFYLMQFINPPST